MPEYYRNRKEETFSEGYDLIGDIHGHADELSALLNEMGYTNTDGCYRHPNRTAIFLGDFIDRGPKQREVLNTVMPMVKSGSALAVMGNHEFNALAYATPDPDNPSEYLRPHTDKNTSQHRAFLDAYKDDDISRVNILNWFRTLPLWLEIDGLRVVHACWDETALDRVSKCAPDALLNDDMLVAASDKDHQMFHDIEVILKGKELELPRGQHIVDKGGIKRHYIRVRWWDRGVTNYRDAYVGPEDARSDIPEDTVNGDHLVEYTHKGPPVFLGHYWLDPHNVQLLANNIACVDFSVARPGGKLVAYRWDGEQQLSNEKFVWVARAEEAIPSLEAYSE